MFVLSGQLFILQRWTTTCPPRCSWIASASTARQLRKRRCIPTNSTLSLCTSVLPWRRDTTWPTLASVRRRPTTPPASVPNRRPQRPPLPTATAVPARIATATTPAAVPEDYSAFSSPSRAVRWAPSRSTIPETIPLSCYAGQSISSLD